ncbi:MAG TPA: hypothetical protein VES03_04565 [Motilibacterales bacterium]|nr:hypothetical protein [Motilibacterales bacterium]
MSEVPAKAQILRLKETAKGTAEKPPTVAVDTTVPPISVQFNPTSLKIERSRVSSGGATSQAQRRNQPNEGHATLTLELEFDTAEGDENGQPLDVRVRTGELRQFIEPPKKPKDPPPRLRFIWGKFSFDGIVERISEDIDYFAADGMALRAKVSLSITEQNEALEANAVGAAARSDSSSTGTGPGGGPTTTPDTALDAQDGESVQQAMTRAGLDPAAWRSAMAGLNSPLGLSAGVQLQLDASVSAGVGLGVTAGFSAGISAGASAGVVVGADAFAGVAGGSAGGTVGASAQASAGFALAAAGGVEAATRGVLAARAEAGDAAARASFAVPGAASAVAGMPAGAGAAASATAGLSSTTAARATVDSRAVGYGRGVPLKPPPRLR